MLRRGRLSRPAPRLAHALHGREHAIPESIITRWTARELVLFTPELSAGARLLYCALDEYAREKGTCWPSQRTLRDRAAMPDRSLRRYLRELEQAGFVESRRRRLRNGPMEYRLSHRPDWPEQRVEFGRSYSLYEARK